MNKTTLFSTAKVKTPKPSGTLQAVCVASGAGGARKFNAHLDVVDGRLQGDEVCQVASLLDEGAEGGSVHGLDHAVGGTGQDMRDAGDGSLVGLQIMPRQRQLGTSLQTWHLSHACLQCTL